LAIDLTMALSIDLLRQLRDGVLDLVLTLYAPKFARELLILPIPASRIMALLPAGHHLAAKPSITPRQLAAERLIMMPENAQSAFGDQCLMILNRHRADLVVPHRSTGSAMTQSMVERGLGIGFVSEFSVRPSAESALVPIDSPQAFLRHVVLTLRHAKPEVRDLAHEIAGAD
jgi:DNA-binding transcriptional LysR family regulator